MRGEVYHLLGGWAVKPSEEDIDLVWRAETRTGARILRPARPVDTSVAAVAGPLPDSRPF